MIGKVVTLRMGKPTQSGFREVLEYISRDGPRFTTRLDLGAMGVINLISLTGTPEDRINIWSAMNATALLACRARSNPVYHVILSWMAGEHPSAQQVEQASTHLMNALGMGECEAFWAIHRDTDHHHAHLVINRIHPELGTVAGPPRQDFFIIDRSMREIELAQGWQHAPGPYGVQYREGQAPAIVRCSRAERNDREFMTQGSNISQGAKRARRNQGVPSFQEWVAGEPAQALLKTIQSAAADWIHVHATLASFGLSMEPKGSGLIVMTEVGNKSFSAKASQLGRWASKPALEQQLGPFCPPASPQRLDADQGYAAFVRKRQQSDEKEAPPQLEARAQRTAGRAAARQALAHRFSQEQQESAVSRRQQRLKLRDQQQRDQAAFRARVKLGKAGFLQRNVQAGMPVRLAKSLWALSVAREQERMQKRQSAERRESAHQISRTLVWRKWLEQESEKGDQAAESALRGIRHRESRQSRHRMDGIEGMVMDNVQPVLSDLRVQVDYPGSRIRYSDQHGRALFTDCGQRIDMDDRSDRAIEAALRLAVQKFGRSLKITGSAEFRNHAAKMAVRLGIMTRNTDLGQKAKQEWSRLEVSRE